MWSGLIRNSGVSGKPILDLKSALMTAQPFFYVLLLLHLFTILLTGYIERSFCTFNVTLFKPNSTLPPSPCFCLVNSSSSHVCGCCVSQLSFKKTCISGTWNVLPGGVYFKVKCFMMQEDTSVCILYRFLLLDVSHCRNLGFKKWHKWKRTLKICFDHELCSLCVFSDV